MKTSIKSSMNRAPKIQSNQIMDFVDVEGEKGSRRFRIITRFPRGRVMPPRGSGKFFSESQISEEALERLERKVSEKGDG